MQGRLHIQTVNVDCAVQCFTNELNQSVLSTIEQKTSCLTENKQLQENLTNCNQDTDNLKQKYKEQTKLLNNVQEERDSATREKEQVTKVQNALDDIKKEKDEVIAQKDAVIKEKETFIKELEDYKQKYTSQSALLHDANQQKKKFIIYEGHLRLIGSIDYRIKQMEMCKLQLQQYCSLIENGKSSDKEEIKNEMERLLDYLECKTEISQDHFKKVKASYARLLNNVLMTKKNLTNLIIKGDFEKMKAAQNREKNLPSDNCHFICDLDVEDSESSYNYGKAFEKAWEFFCNIFS